MKLLATLVLCTLPALVFSQDHSFPYGQITIEQFDQKAPVKDSTAVAIVLNEFGEAYINSDGQDRLILEHHYVIKILKQAGVEEANIAIPLWKSDKNSNLAERLISLKATSYNLENGKIQQTQLEEKNIFTENTTKYLNQKKFTIPNVRQGSIIEVTYLLESPFFYQNFRRWEFQSHLPKLISEYWATIPGNYNYNISWKGYLKFKKNEGEIVNDCFNAGNGQMADCARYKFSMVNIPAFIEEEYMTASSNFIASVNFELLEIRHYDGHIDKVTNEWKDADTEMKQEQYFGPQMKKGRELSLKIGPVVAGVTDPLEKAGKIYDFMKAWYTWDGFYSMYSKGIKKAFDAKTGSIGDINLALIAALRYYDLNVEALTLSTREKGLPTDLFPVLNDFNYVVAKLNIGDKVYLLDASDPYLTFGMLPERCLNGKGRVFPEKAPSYWYDLKPSEKLKRVTTLDLTLSAAGTFTGTIQSNYYGYSASNLRQRISSFNNQDEYVEELKKKSNGITIAKYEISGLDDSKNSVKEKFEVEIEGFDNINANNLLLNPFFVGKIERNPFRLNERLFPVDFGAPMETTIILNLTYPSSLALESAPDKVALTLPNAGGRFLFDVVSTENKVTMNYVFSIDKAVFNSTEYRSLKELYNRVIQTQRTDLIFKKVK